MAVAERRPPTVAVDPAVLKKLSTLDRFLPLWIAPAMMAGLGLGALITSLNDGLDRLRVGTVSLPIVTPASIYVCAGSMIVTPPNRCFLAMRSRISRSASASATRSLTPNASAASSVQ